ncbi:MAG: hypothetical protein ACE5HR_00225 [bacterium]
MTQNHNSREDILAQIAVLDVANMIHGKDVIRNYKRKELLEKLKRENEKQK